MIHFPVLRWGEPYDSLETEQVRHFATGEPIAEVSQANPGIVARDLRKARRAREALREIPPRELLRMLGVAADLFMSAELPLGEGTQSADDFVRQQSATTGLSEAMCRNNMDKLRFVLEHLEQILESLTRGLDLDILARGHGAEGKVLRSYQATTPALGMVLPSNSPGVHTLWMPVIPLQIGLVLKPGPQEPWTPWRMAQAFFGAGVPRCAIGVYPGGAEVGAAVLRNTPRSLVFGGLPTVEAYRGNPAIQVHGPGFSKILLGDDIVDDWERHLDLMLDSVLVNSGRSCINCSGIWVSRNSRQIAAALAQRLVGVQALAPEHEDAQLAAFTVPGMAPAISGEIDAALDTPGAEDVTAAHRGGPRLIQQPRCDYLLPTVIHCDSPQHPLAAKEYMFPFVSVVQCPQEQMLDSIGDTLVASALTEDEGFRRQLLDARNIDRLNFGPIPTIQLNWLQPHEGNIVDFLYRARAFQSA